MPGRNQLLDSIPQHESERVRQQLQEISLPQGLEISPPGKVDKFCYFPISGIGSTVVVSPEGKQTEVGVFGREGMSPVSAMLGADRNPYRVVMQVGGQAFRIERLQLLEMLEGLPRLRDVMLQWSHVFTAQIAATALSNSVHSVDQRLARWILMCHDRLDGNEIPLTHEFLSIMLAVRRPSVTTSLHMLEGERLIYSHRGLIIVRDRAALKMFAADAYGTSESEYARLLGPFT